MDEHNLVCRHLRITGRVQGVGYRDWAQGTARSLGLSGWVRNRRDGSVEALAVGASDAIEAFVRACREGPAMARVDGVCTREGEATPLEGFEFRATI